MNISGYSGFNNPVNMQQKMQETFAAADADQDGVLSLQEMQASAEADGIDAERAEQLFTQLDTDGDGQLSADEQAAHIESLENRMQSIGGGVMVNYDQKSEESFQQLLQSLEQELGEVPEEAAAAFHQKFPPIDVMA